MFLPAESLFSAALEGDRDLILWAASKRIFIATPASLIALLRSVSVSWQQYAQTENAQKIAEAAQELYSRIAKFTEHFEKIRSGLERANAAFNDAAASFQSRVRPAGERLAELGGGAAGKEFIELNSIDNSLRLTEVSENGSTSQVRHDKAEVNPS
jgi:DNA recombination protein RmuC